VIINKKAINFKKKLCRVLRKQTNLLIKETKDLYTVVYHIKKLTESTKRFHKCKKEKIKKRYSDIFL
jgi:hypothetical protein